ncbi:MAG TPA: site-specific integrase [Pirellulales bacterium]|nr:site-specific integrase [Pirellulales bacterium]
MTIRGKRYRLGAAKEGAETEFHKLMGNPETPVSGNSVAAIIDKFLDYAKTHNAESTYDWYRKYLQDFVDHLKPKTLKVAKLKKHHVTEWLDAHPTWGNSKKRGALTAVRRVFNWAEEEEHLSHNPLHKKLKKPPAGHQDLTMLSKIYAKVQKNVDHMRRAAAKATGA